MKDISFGFLDPANAVRSSLQTPADSQNNKDTFSKLTKDFESRGPKKSSFQLSSRGALLGPPPGLQKSTSTQAYMLGEDSMSKSSYSKGAGGNGIIVRSRNIDVKSTNSYSNLNARFKIALTTMNKEIASSGSSDKDSKGQSDRGSSFLFKRRVSVMRLKKELDPVYEVQKKISKNFQSLTQINAAQRKIQERLAPPKSVYETEKPTDQNINNRYLQGPITSQKLLKKIKWDINSPRFKKIQLKLGFDDEDLELKELSDFGTALGKKADSKISQMRYNHHLLSLQGKLNQIIEGRLRLIARKDDDSYYRQPLQSSREVPDYKLDPIPEKRGIGVRSRLELPPPSIFDSPGSKHSKGLGSPGSEKQLSAYLEHKHEESVRKMVQRQKRYFSKLAQENEKQLRKAQELKISEEHHKKCRQTLKEKEEDLKYVVEKNREKRQLKLVKIKKQNEAEEAQWMQSHQKLIEEADLRKAKLENTDQKKMELLRKKGDEEREKLLQAKKKRAECEAEEEKQTQDLIEKFEQKLQRSQRNQKEILKKKKDLAIEQHSKFTSIVERAATVKNQVQMQRLEVAERDMLKFRKVIRNQKDIEKYNRAQIQQKNREKLMKFKTQRKEEQLGHAKQLELIEKRLKGAQAAREQERREHELQIQIKHEKERLQQEDRKKLIEKERRKLQYKKELVLQKHLSHQLLRWSQQKEQEKLIEEKKSLNIFLNDFKHGFQNEIKEALRSNRSPLESYRSALRPLDQVSSTLEVSSRMSPAQMYDALRVGQEEMHAKGSRSVMKF